MAAKSCSSGAPEHGVPFPFLLLVHRRVEHLLALVGAIFLDHRGMRLGRAAFAAEVFVVLAHRHGQPPATQPRPSQTQKVLSAPSYHSTPTPSISAKAPMAIHVAHSSSRLSCVHSSSHRSGWACGPQAALIRPLSLEWARWATRY